MPHPRAQRSWCSAQLTMVGSASTNRRAACWASVGPAAHGAPPRAQPGDLYSHEAGPHKATEGLRAHQALIVQRAGLRDWQRAHAQVRRPLRRRQGCCARRTPVGAALHGGVRRAAGWDHLRGGQRRVALARWDANLVIAGLAVCTALAHTT